MTEHAPELEALYRERYASVVRFAYVVLGDRAVAEELTQEAFVRTWKNWHRIRDPRAGHAFVRTTVLNLARSALRRRALEFRSRQRRVDVHEDPDVPMRMSMVQALQELPMRQRMCLVLRYYEDLSEQQTAEVLGVSVGTVKSTTHRALRKLEQIIGDRT